ILLATGSELQLAMDARQTLLGAGVPTRVVSLPCWERFAQQDPAYRAAVLPPEATARVSIEVGVSLGWDRWVGPQGAMIALEHFGASAPANVIFEHLGFTAGHLVDVARSVLDGTIRGVVAAP
ncbi:MAG: transketolase-like TK C-terminal-containing protein, partial [Candidatus Limnocylindrales bacterium]